MMSTQQIPTGLPPAGWYPDPQNPAAQRYWDGAGWAAQQVGPRPAFTPGSYTPVKPPRKSHKAPAVVAVVAVVLLVGIIGSVASGGNKGGTAGTSAGPASTAAKVGTPVRDGKFEFTVTNVTCGATTVGSGADFGAATAQGQFCVATMTVRNIGGQAQMLDAGDQYAFSGDTKYDADPLASINANNGTDAFLNNINPGNQVTVRVVWDVPKGVRLTRLELHDSMFSGGVDVTVAPAQLVPTS